MFPATPSLLAAQGGWESTRVVVKRVDHNVQWQVRQTVIAIETHKGSHLKRAMKNLLARHALWPQP